MANAVLRFTENSSTQWGGSARHAEIDGDSGRTHKLVVLPKFLDQVELDALMKLAKAGKFRKDADSVDELPTHELRLIEMGRQSKGRAREAADLLGKKGFGGRVQRFVRENYACKTCVVCEALMRRYRSGERMQHFTHFDTSAYATFVIAMSREDAGGLYVQANSSSTSRQYLGLDAGDAVAHQYDLRHGVQIHRGSRMSIILWVKDHIDSCKEGTSPWYFESARNGDANGQYHVGSAYLNGMGVDAEPSTAVKWFRKAADQGQPDAQRWLGLMHRKGDGGLRKDPDLAEQWLRKAASAQAMAAFDLAQHLSEQGRAFEAAEFFRASAAENYTQAMFNLGSMLEEGQDDLKRNVSEAEMWFRRAAAIGDPKAQNYLADLIALRIVIGDESEAVKWYQRAALQGHDMARKQLEVRKAAAAGDVGAQKALAEFLAGRDKNSNDEL